MSDQMNLQDLIEQEGQPINNMQTVPTDEAVKEIDAVIDNQLAYDNGNIVMPGAAVKMPTSDDVMLDKEQANEKLIQTLAEEKLRKEQEEFNKLSDNEKIKQYIFAAEYRRCINEFFNKNHFEMTGQQKRVTKRKIERAWNKGKYKLTPEQKQDILYELNKASNSKKVAQPTNTSPQNKVATDLQSLITKI